MVRVVLFGLGHLGKWHAQKVVTLDESELVAVVDPSETAKDTLESIKVNVPIFKGLNDCDVDFDAAIVSTPTSIHFQICKELLSQGKHVFCEKPMTSTYQQSLELKELFDQKDVVFQVGHSERFHKIWPIIREKNEYFSGAPCININRQAAFKGRSTDVDVVQDLMIHDIDLMLYLLGESPMEVKAIGKKIRTNFWDYAEATFFFNSGAQATLRVGRNYVNEVRTFEIINEAGAIQVDMLNRKVLEASGKSKGEEPVQVESYEPRDHLLEEQKLFYKSISGGVPVAVDIEAGMKAVFLVGKVLESIETGKGIRC